MKTYILKETERAPKLFEGGIIRFVYGSTVYEKEIEPVTSIFDVKEEDVESLISQTKSYKRLWNWYYDAGQIDETSKIYDGLSFQDCRCVFITNSADRKQLGHLPKKDIYYLTKVLKEIKKEERISYDVEFEKPIAKGGIFSNPYKMPLGYDKYSFTLSDKTDEGFGGAEIEIEISLFVKQGVTVEHKVKLIRTLTINWGSGESEDGYRNSTEYSYNRTVAVEDSFKIKN